MKKTICIVELYDHHEVVNVLCKLYQHLGYEVQIFAEKNLLANLDCPNTLQVVKKETENQQTFIRQNLLLFNKSDLIIFTTLVKYPNFFANLSLSPPTILLIHDGNYFLRPIKAMQIGSVKDFFRWIKFQLFQEAKNRRKLLKKVSFISFAGDFMATQFVKEIDANKIKTLPTLPLNYFKRNSSPNEIIRIIIPGSVNKSRDYRMVFAAFQQISKKISKPVEIILLGSSDSYFGQRITKQFLKLSNKNIKIIYNKDSFPQKSYDQILSTASLAIIPIRKEFKRGLIAEKYGKTKITGSINDVITYGIPTLLASHYPYPTDLSQLFFHFKGQQQLAELILSHLKNKDRDYPAFAPLQNYTIQQRSKSLESITKKALSVSS